MAAGLPLPLPSLRNPLKEQEMTCMCAGEHRVTRERGITFNAMDWRLMPMLSLQYLEEKQHYLCSLATAFVVLWHFQSHLTEVVRWGGLSLLLPTTPVYLLWITSAELVRINKTPPRFGSPLEKL